MLRGESYIDFCMLWVIMMFACGREGGGASVTNHILKFRKVVEFETSGIVICFSYIYRYVQKVGPSPRSPCDPRAPQDLEILWEPTATIKIHRDPRDLFQPPRHCRTPWNPEKFPGTTGIPPDVMREKHLSGITINFFIFKKLQFFSYKNLSILNRLFLGNNLLEFFSSLLKSIKYNLIHIS